jgi:hypothetical protein
VFDVNGRFPTKTLDIQDIADVEFLVLEVHDDYLFTDFHSMTENFIICYGDRARQNIIFFCRETGLPVSEISRFGQGPEEYQSRPHTFVYSESKDELFLFDNRNIKVYGRDGTFKRSFPRNNLFFPNGLKALYDYDDDYLIFNGFPISGVGMEDTTFVLISKLDGSIVNIPVPYTERPSLIFTEGGMPTIAEGFTAVRNGRDFLLTDYSCDTVWRFTPERVLSPVLVRKPPIRRMNTRILLHSWLETSEYKFFSTQRLEHAPNSGIGAFFDSPRIGYLMEKSSGNFFRSNVQMSEFRGRELIISPAVINRTASQCTGIIVFDAIELHDANDEGRLSGKLKEVVDNLTEDDEFVFMILNFR